jgi:hypothetical protein
MAKPNKEGISTKEIFENFEKKELGRHIRATIKTANNEFVLTFIDIDFKELKSQILQKEQELLDMIKDLKQQLEEPDEVCDW